MVSSGRTLLDESSPTTPDTFYGETKLAAERVALDCACRGWRPLATVLRSAAVYGPRVKGNYLRLVRALARHRFVPIGPGDNLRTLVFEDDLAAATALAATHPAAEPDESTTSRTDSRIRSARSLRRFAPRSAVVRPRWHAPVGAGSRRPSRSRRSSIGGCPRMLDKYLEEVAVDGSRIQRELGFRPTTEPDGWMEGHRRGDANERGVI